MLWYSCYFMFLFFNPVNKGKGKFNLTLILCQQSYYIAISYHSVSHQINTWHYWAELFTLTFIRSFCLQFCTQGCTVKKKESDVRRHRQTDNTRERVRERQRDKLNTWWGSDAEVACEVIFECIENSRHIPLHFIQIDDVFHQCRINVHLSWLALCLGLEDEKRKRKESTERRV